MNTPQIGILGLGIIGSRVAENVAKAGFAVVSWNRTPKGLPHSVGSALEVAQAAEVIQIFVRDDEALLSVMKDITPALTAAHVVLNHATVSPEATHQAAAIAQAAGAAFLDCPFTGSKIAAQNGKLSYYVGGDAAVLERVRPVLEASSAKILHVGELGHATILKIVTNLVTAVTVKGVAEALGITKAHGIAPEQLLATLEINANFIPLIGMKLPAMMSGDYEPHFSLKNMLKDADYALNLAGEKSVEAPALSAMAEAMRSAVEAGHAEEDFSVIGQYALLS
jgi:3-hydroxyisobutyrate dehydrogenase-like beta-hydroxyacid dehydrogenase